MTSGDCYIEGLNLPFAYRMAARLVSGLTAFAEIPASGPLTPLGGALGLVVIITSAGTPTRLGTDLTLF